MINTFKTQIETILKNTEKKEVKKADDKKALAAVTMFKLMIGAISRYVETEAQSNKTFDEALSCEWKSAERMLKFVFGHAKDLAVSGTYAGMNGACCCVPDDVVFDWINEYYFADDKEEFEKEKADAEKKKAEQEARAKADAEKEAKAREMAIEKLSAEEGWDLLSEEEKEKKIATEARSLKYKLSTKKTTEKKSKSTKKEKTVLDTALEEVNEVCEDMAEKSEHTPDIPKNCKILSPEETQVELDEENAVIDAEINADEEKFSSEEIKENEDGQFSLFDLM